MTSGEVARTACRKAAGFAAKTAAVQPIVRYGVAHVGEVLPDLVGPTGFWPAAAGNSASQEHGGCHTPTVAGLTRLRVAFKSAYYITSYT